MQLIKTNRRMYSFDEMLKKQRESGRFHELLRTAVATGFFAFDEVLLTRLTTSEQSKIDQLGRRTPQLYDFDPLPVEWAFPKKFGCEVDVASPILLPELDEFPFYFLTGGEGGAAQAYVQARHFLTALKRHPNAVAYFRAGKPNPRNPITFLEDGKPVALLMPILPRS